MVIWNHSKKMATHPQRLFNIIIAQLYNPPSWDHCLTVANSAAQIAVGIDQSTPPMISHKMVLKPLEAIEG